MATTQTSAKPAPRETGGPTGGPITDPADLWTLIGRFVAGQVLNVLVVACLLRKAMLPALLLAVTSLFVHRALVKLWRKLSAERVAALAARPPVSSPALSEDNA